MHKACFIVPQSTIETYCDCDETLAKGQRRNAQSLVFQQKTFMKLSGLDSRCLRAGLRIVTAVCTAGLLGNIGPASHRAGIRRNVNHGLDEFPKDFVSKCSTEDEQEIRSGEAIEIRDEVENVDGDGVEPRDRHRNREEKLKKNPSLFHSKDKLRSK